MSAAHRWKFFKQLKFCRIFGEDEIYPILGLCLRCVFYETVPLFFHPPCRMALRYEKFFLSGHRSLYASRAQFYNAKTVRANLCHWINVALLAGRGGWGTGVWPPPHPFLPPALTSQWGIMAYWTGSYDGAIAALLSAEAADAVLSP